MTWAYALLAVTVLVAAFIQGSTGMGFALIAVPVFSLVEPTLVPVVVLVLMLPLNGYVALRERRAIDWLECAGSPSAASSAPSPGCGSWPW